MGSCHFTSAALQNQTVIAAVALLCEKVFLSSSVSEIKNRWLRCYHDNTEQFHVSDWHVFSSRDCWFSNRSFLSLAINVSKDWRFKNAFCFVLFSFFIQNVKRSPNWTSSILSMLHFLMGSCHWQSAVFQNQTIISGWDYQCDQDVWILKVC